MSACHSLGTELAFQVCLGASHHWEKVHLFKSLGLGGGEVGSPSRQCRSGVCRSRRTNGGTRTSLHPLPGEGRRMSFFSFSVSIILPGLLGWLVGKWVYEPKCSLPRCGVGAWKRGGRGPPPGAWRLGKCRLGAVQSTKVKAVAWGQS